MIDDNIIKNSSNKNKLTEEDKFIKQELMENKLKIFILIKYNKFSEGKNKGNKILILKLIFHQ